MGEVFTNYLPKLLNVDNFYIDVTSFLRCGNDRIREMLCGHNKHTKLYTGFAKYFYDHLNTEDGLLFLEDFGKAQRDDILSFVS